MKLYFVSKLFLKVFHREMSLERIDCFKNLISFGSFAQMISFKIFLLSSRPLESS